MNFEDFIITKNDVIYNAAHRLLCALVSNEATLDDDVIEWDMEKIGGVVDLVQKALNDAGIQTCYPYSEQVGFDEPVPCYLGSDCKNLNCLCRKLDDDWVAIRTGSDGTNEDMDGLVFVPAEYGDKAAVLCSAGMEAFFNDEYGDCCWLDCVEFKLKDENIPHHSIAADVVDEQLTEEWEEYVASLYAAGKIVYEAYAIGVYKNEVKK